VSLNLHSAVRGMIQAVNADISATYLQSTGYTLNASGQQVATYAQAKTVQIQVQPPSGRDLQHMEFLNLQGVVRTVFLYSNPQAVDRIHVQGGDLLQFPQFHGEPIDNWLVTYVDQTWDVGLTGWTKLIVTLQTDRPS
jgi:hypothetical protein